MVSVDLAAFDLAKARERKKIGTKLTESFLLDTITMGLVLKNRQLIITRCIQEKVLHGKYKSQDQGISRPPTQSSFIKRLSLTFSNTDIRAYLMLSL